MSFYTQYARTRFADLRSQIAEQFTPRLKFRIAVLFVGSLGLAALMLVTLAFIKATYEPLTWAILVSCGAAYGWFAHDGLVMASMIDDLYDVFSRYDADEEEDD